MKVTSYIVGEKYQNAIGHRDEIKFDVNDGGIIIPIYMYKPTENEIAQMKDTANVRMALVARDDVIIMLLKFGSMNWMDAPYSPWLSRDLTHLPDSVGPDEGFATHLLLFDTSNGELMTQRLFSLQSKLSNDLIKEIRRIKAKPFNMQAYSSDIKSAYRYTTDELVKQAQIVYRIQ